MQAAAYPHPYDLAGGVPQKLGARVLRRPVEREQEILADERDAGRRRIVLRRRRGRGWEAALRFTAHHQAAFVADVQNGVVELTDVAARVFAELLDGHGDLRGRRWPIADQLRYRLSSDLADQHATHVRIGKNGEGEIELGVDVERGNLAKRASAMEHGLYPANLHQPPRQAHRVIELAFANRRLHRSKRASTQNLIAGCAATVAKMKASVAHKVH